MVDISVLAPKKPKWSISIFNIIFRLGIQLKIDRQFAYFMQMTHANYDLILIY